MTFLAIYKYKAYKFHRFFMWIFSGQNGVISLNYIVVTNIDTLTHQQKLLTLLYCEMKEKNQPQRQGFEKLLNNSF